MFCCRRARRTDEFRSLGRKYALTWSDASSFLNGDVREIEKAGEREEMVASKNPSSFVTLLERGEMRLLESVFSHFSD